MPRPAKTYAWWTSSTTHPRTTSPASFIATPIDDGPERLGVLVFQMPVEEIERVMTGNQNWWADGLGETGETYLVGPDFKMRSDSRFILEDPAGYLAALEDAGVSAFDLTRIRDFGTSILLQEVRTRLRRRRSPARPPPR